MSGWGNNKDHGCRRAFWLSQVKLRMYLKWLRVKKLTLVDFFPKQQSKQRCTKTKCGCWLHICILYNFMLIWITAERTPVWTDCLEFIHLTWVANETIRPLWLAFQHTGDRPVVSHLLHYDLEYSINSTPRCWRNESVETPFATSQEPHCPTRERATVLARHCETDFHFSPG